MRRVDSARRRPARSRTWRRAAEFSGDCLRREGTSEQLQRSGYVGGQHAVRSDLAAHGNPLVDPRVHGMEGLGRCAIVLGGVELAAELQYPAVELVKECAKTRLDLKIDADIPAGNREAQRRLVAGPEQLE